jgi:hypothetical protein
MTRRPLALLLGILVAAAGFTSGASAGKPTLERIAVDESFVDDFLSEECGVQVTTRALGQVIIREWTDGTGVQRVATLNVVLTATAGDNTIRFRDVGADLLRVEPDGTAILMIIGQIPFDFTGVLKIDLETDEAILEPHHDTSGGIEKACAALTA